MSFELQDHPADVAIVGRGDSLGAAFAAVADGMAAASCDDWPAEGEVRSLTVSAGNLEALLFDYLDELIYRRDIEAVLPVDNTATVADRNDAYRLEGTYRGVPLSAIHARDVKAPTYAEMAIEETTGGWKARVVLDV